MMCDAVRRLLGAYVDNELKLTRQPDLEKHLAGCQSCQAAAEEINNFSSQIRMHFPVYKAPVELTAKIRASLRRESRPKSDWFCRVCLPLTYAAAVLVASLAVPRIWRTFSPAKDQALVGQAISNHVRSLIAAHLVDINSSDQHTVKKWFTDKSDYSAPVVDLSDAGYTLIGGRIDMLDQRPVAAIVYQHGNHFINLVVWLVASRKNRPGSQIRSRLRLLWLEQGGFKLLVHFGCKRHRLGRVRGQGTGAHKTVNPYWIGAVLLFIPLASIAWGNN